VKKDMGLPTSKGGFLTKSGSEKKGESYYEKGDWGKVNNPITRKRG